MSDTNSLKCRKCGGNHLTIKCGKDNGEKTTNKSPKYNDNNKSPSYEIVNNKSPKYNDNKSSSYEIVNNKSPKYNDNNKLHHDDNKSKFSRPFTKYGKVKITDLPKDITVEELQEFLYDWGDIKYINIKEYYNDTVAYIEFKDEKQADYLIEALNNTPFDGRIIKVTKLE